MINLIADIKLIVIRALAAIANSFYMFTLLTFINLFIAIVLSHLGFIFIVDTKLVVLIGFAAYSYFGDSHIGRWPSFAKKRLGISVIIDKNSRNKYIYLGIRTAFYYGFVVSGYYLYVSITKALFASPDELAQQAIKYPFDIGILLFVNILLPISVFFSCGQRGLHDIISHTRVVLTRNKQSRIIADKTVIINSVIASLCLAFVFSFVASAYQSRAYSKSAINHYDEIKNAAHKALGQLPFAFQDEAQVSSDGIGFLITRGGNYKPNPLRAWVDVSSNINKRIVLGRLLGLCSQETDNYCRAEASSIFGYGIIAGELARNIHLVGMDNKAITLLPVGSKVFKVIVFVDTGVLDYHEMVEKARDTILSSLTKYSQFYDFYDVLSIRIEHLVKVGWVSFGRCDDVFIPVDKGGLWRYFCRPPVLEPDFTDPFSYGKQYICSYDIK